MKLFVWGTLTSEGGNGWAMKDKWRSEYLGPAHIQGMYGELYNVPDEHVKAMDSFENRFGYVRLMADRMEEIWIYIKSARADGYYTGNKVLEKAQREEVVVREIGPEIEYV